MFPLLLAYCYRDLFLLLDRHAALRSYYIDSVPSTPSCCITISSMRSVHTAIYRMAMQVAPSNLLDTSFSLVSNNLRWAFHGRLDAIPGFEPWLALHRLTDDLHDLPEIYETFDSVLSGPTIRPTRASARSFSIASRNPFGLFMRLYRREQRAFARGADRDNAFNEMARHRHPQAEILRNALRDHYERDAVPFDYNDPDAPRIIVASLLHSTRLFQYLQRTFASLLLLDDLRCDLTQWLSARFNRGSPINSDFYDWLDNAYYTQGYKEKLSQIYRTINLNDHTNNRHIYHLFIKREHYGEQKGPRCICAPDDFHKVILQPYVKALESVIYASGNFIKHVPVQERCAWLDAQFKSYHRFYVTDFSSFESSFMLSLTHVVQGTVLEFVPRASHIPSVDIKEYVTQSTSFARFVSSLGIRGSIHTKRRSGDPYTSLFNGLANLFAQRLILRRLGCTGQIVVEGDDGLVGYSGFLTDENVVDICYSIGLRIDFKQVPSPAMSGFLSTYYVSGLAIREPSKQILSYSSSFSAASGFSPERNLELLRGRMYGALAEANGSPIICGMLRWLKERLPPGPISYNSFYFRELLALPRDFIFTPVQVEIKEPDDHVRAVYSDVFGINIPTQLQIEHDFERFGCSYLFDYIVAQNNRSLRTLAGCVFDDRIMASPINHQHLQRDFEKRNPYHGSPVVHPLTALEASVIRSATGICFSHFVHHFNDVRAARQARIAAARRRAGRRAHNRHLQEHPPDHP